MAECILIIPFRELHRQRDKSAVDGCEPRHQPHAPIIAISQEEGDASNPLIAISISRTIFSC